MREELKGGGGIDSKGVGDSHYTHKTLDPMFNKERERVLSEGKRN